MVTAQEELFLLDLDDTLLDTTRLKNDLFLSIARCIGSETPELKKADDIKRLYKIFCQKNQGIVSYQGFADFLIKIFKGQESEIKGCFEFDFKKYLMPEAKLTLDKLKKQGTVLIWTAGTYEDQVKKLLDTGLISSEEAEKILQFSDFENQKKQQNKLPLAVVDTGKVLGIQERLNWFLKKFPEREITLIDNEVKNINGVVEANQKRLKAIWIDHGEQKDPNLAKEFRQKLPPQIQRFESLLEMNKFLHPEGSQANPEQKG